MTQNFRQGQTGEFECQGRDWGRTRNWGTKCVFPNLQLAVVKTQVSIKYPITVSFRSSNEDLSVQREDISSFKARVAAGTGIGFGGSANQANRQGYYCSAQDAFHFVLVNGAVI